MANAGNKDNTGSTNVANSQESEPDEAKLDDPDIHFDHLCKQISQFVTSISSIDKSQPLETPQFLDDFLETIESDLNCYESDPSKFTDSIKNSSSFFKAIDCLSVLIESVSKFRSVSSSAAILINLATSLLHRAMLILINELLFLLHKREAPDSQSDNPNPPKDEAQDQDQEKQQSESGEQQTQSEIFPPYAAGDVALIGSITKSMIRGGYRGECKRLFVTERRRAFEDELTCQGFEKMSIDDVQRMQWEPLESVIATWIHVIKRCTSLLFPGELRFYGLVFASDPSQFRPNCEIRSVVFDDLVTAVVQQLLNLAHAVAMTRRSSEKLFKFLDMYEAIRGLGSWLEDSSSSFTEDRGVELKAELAPAGGRLGEAAVSIFCELENSIKNDNAKQPVAYGAVHPLTRYVMNYLKYACEYKATLEELFVRHLGDVGGATTTPLTAQLMRILDLLEANVEAKSKLYKDGSLRCIFLMNNGRYMLQKIKGSEEMHESLVDTWCRKRSSDVRSYHKNYQRDTWGRVLRCLTQEGLVVHGKVHKPVLKERFKNFNQSFDEIHKTQSVWVVSDEQMKSELRVSISAVMIPAYRAFVARFGPVFTPGRQYEKHIKYQPEDIESAIEELFEGNC